MALIHHNQVEEIFSITLVWLLLTWLHLLFILHPLPIKTHVNLKTTFGILALHLRHHFAERLEVLTHGLVDENITVSEIKDAFHASRCMQTMDDLESRIGLSRTRSHDQENPFFSTSHRLNHLIDGYALVVARRITVAITIIRNVEQLSSLFRQVHVVVHPLAIAFTESQGRGEIVHADGTLSTRIHVVLHKLLTV